MKRSKNIFATRQETMQALLKAWNISFLLVEDLLDIFYFTGLKLSAGSMVFSEKSVFLFVDGRYFAFAKKAKRCHVKESNIENFIQYLIPKQEKKETYLGFDKRISYQNLEFFKKVVRKINQNKKKLGSIKLKAMEEPTSSLRIIKAPLEIQAIKKSAKLLSLGFLHAKSLLRVGIEEREVALEFEYFCKKKGATALSFPSIIAFGSNSAYPHHETGSRKLKQGDLVLMDFGIYVDGYASDMTRTFFFGDKKDNELEKIREVVAQAKKAAIRLCYPEVSIKKLNQAVQKVMKKAGYDKEMLHSLGHGVGLAVHEAPNFRKEQQKLKPGMVITIEPGVYLPGKGGVRLEDMIIITETGHLNLFEFL